MNEQDGTNSMLESGEIRPLILTTRTHATVETEDRYGASGTTFVARIKEQSIDEYGCQNSEKTLMEVTGLPTREIASQLLCESLKYIAAKGKPL